MRSWTRAAGTSSQTLYKKIEVFTLDVTIFVYSWRERDFVVCHLACVSLGVVSEVDSSSLCPTESPCVIYSGDTLWYDPRLPS